MKLVTVVAVTCMMHTVTRPTILRRSLSLKLTTRCQTGTSLLDRHGGLNHILLIHWLTAHLIMTPALETLRRRWTLVSKTFMTSEDVPRWNDVMFPERPLSVPPRDELFKTFGFLLLNVSMKYNVLMAQPGDRLTPVSTDCPSFSTESPMCRIPQSWTN